MTSRSVFDIVEPGSLASDPSRRRAKRSLLCSTIAVLLVATPHGNLAWAAGIKTAVTKTETGIKKTGTGIASAPHIASRTSQLFAFALFGQASSYWSSADLSGPRATGMTLANMPTSELIDLQAKTYQVQARPYQIQAKPETIQAKPYKIQARPDPIRAEPDPIQTKIYQMQAKTDHIQVKTGPAQVKPYQTQAKTDQKQVEPYQIKAKTSQLATAVQLVQTRLRRAMFGIFDMLRGPMQSGSAVEQTAAYGSAIAVDRQLVPKHLGAIAINSVSKPNRTITTVSRNTNNDSAAYGATLTPFIAGENARLQSVEEASKALDVANAHGADAKGKS